MQPIVFKPNILGPWDICFNCHNSRHMIWDIPSKSEGTCPWKGGWPSLGHKAPINFSNNGCYCMLDQVKAWPFSGISCTPSLLIAELKFNMWCMFAPGLFLFSCDQIRLKSPRNIHGLSDGIDIWKPLKKQLSTFRRAWHIDICKPPCLIS